MSFEKFLTIVKLLLWKSWKIRIHYKKCFIALFILPLLLPALTTLSIKLSGHSWHESYSGNGSYIPGTYTEPMDIFDISFHQYMLGHCNEEEEDCVNDQALFYTPDTNYTRKVMQSVKNILKEKRSAGNLLEISLKPMKSELEIRRAIKQESSHSGRPLGGIAFQVTESNSGSIPLNIHYDIITKDFVSTSSLYTFSYEEVWREVTNFAFDSYVYENFLVLQTAVDIAHIKLISDKIHDVNVHMQHFPIPGTSKTSSSYNHFTPLISLSFAISLLFIFPVCVKRIVEEKSTRVKEYLTCCGVNPGLYWTATHLDTFCLIAVQVFALIAIYSIPINFSIYMKGFYFRQNVYISMMQSMNASIALMFIVFIMYCIQTTLFASFLTIFFENANVAAAVAIVACILTSMYPIFSKLAQFKSIAISSIFPNCALFWIIFAFRGRHYLHQEMNGLSNLFTSTRWGDPLTVGEVLLLMIISSIMYGLLTWYLTEIWRWQKGVAKPWYFPFRKHYNKYVLKKEPNYASQVESPLIIENVSKLYGSSRRKVLNNVSFDIEDNALTVLLGPNGSGKSTLINIICGLSEQSEGNTYVKGNNIEDKLETAQSYLGFCPQHNTYFKYLTVRENLEMIFTLKRELRERIDGYKVEEIIEMLNLQQFAHEITINLSGGVLRRLTLAMAMVGPSDVLVIDEPTESLDPMAKRNVWDILVHSRDTKAILVCSHQLDEVNVIADKVALLIYGELKCVNTTLDLKKEYGMGYTLRIKKNPEFLTNDKIESIITENSENSSCQPFSSESEELVFRVPFNECSKMPLILKELEMRQFDFGIESMSLFATTLEDVYEKIIAEESRDKETVDNEWNFDKSGDEMEEMNDDQRDNAGSKLKTICGQLQSLILKNFYYSTQHLSLLIIFIAIPLILILIILLTVRIITQRLGSIPSNTSFKPDLYGKYTRSFVSSTDHIFVEAYQSLSAGVEEYTGNPFELQDWLLNIADNDLVDYFKNFLFGASFNETNAGFVNLTVWMNPSARHAAAISLNTAMNAMLSTVSPSSVHSITVENKWSQAKANFDINFIYQYSGVIEYLLQPLIIAIYSLCYAAYVIRPVAERSIGFTHLQLMTGVQPVIYWSAHFIFDLLYNFACSAIYVLFFYLIDTGNIFAASDYFIPSLLLLFFFAGFAQIPFMYFFSFAFKKPTSAYLFMSIFCIISGLSLFLFTTGIALKYFNPTLLLIILPFIAFPHSLSLIYTGFDVNTICDRVTETESLSFCFIEYHTYITDKICCPNLCSNDSIVWQLMQNCTGAPNPLLHEEYGGINALHMIGVMLVSGMLYFALTNLVEYNNVYGFLFQCFYNFKNSFQMINTQFNPGQQESEEVMNEANYVSDIIESNRISQESLVIKELTKQFDSLRIPNKVNLTVRKGECLGLLGSNACGKTTTFKLLTSQMKPTFGNAYINDFNTNLTSNTPKYLSLVGYCPQTDALFDCLTGQQTLNLFANLRGLNHSHQIQRLINKFQLQSVIHQRVSTYSGGNRRKLSLATALIGNQKLLLLDEPTNGVDPCSRHKVWKLLRHISETFQVSVLLTSHNMQEVEFLCDRIAVMSIGKLRCIGFVKELKDKYGKGFNIIIKFEREVAENDEKLLNSKHFIEELFTDENLTLQYENFGVLYYNLITNSVSLSNIFEKLEDVKNHCKVEDYIVSNANLEQSLLRFMKQ